MPWRRDVCRMLLVAAACGLSLAAFPGIVETFVTVNASLYATLRGEKVAAWREVVRPHAGEQVLPREVTAMLSLLRKYHVESYRISPAIHEIDLFRQRLIEGAYPVRKSDGAPYLLAVRGEVLPMGFTVLDEQAGVILATAR